jgi:UDP-N-acetylmuramoyl-tripeptide--D-alanyl-D-alanine ligase
MKFTIDQLLGAMDGKLLKKGKIPVFSGEFVMDSRLCRENSIFFALKGEQSDGHDYLKSAVKKGATLLIVERFEDSQEFSDISVIKVKSSLDALINAGKVVRSLIEGSKILAVTGSCGKTSTKEFIKSALSPKGKVGATKGNYNNHLGVPLTLGSFSGDESFYVIEMGMNHPGEIGLLAEVCKPKIGVITSICPVHLEGVGSLDGVRSAKGELLDHIIKGGTAVLPVAELSLAKKAKSLGLRVVTFGESNLADFNVADFKTTIGGSSYSLLTSNQSFEVILNVGGIHQATNSAAAIAAAYLMGVPMEKSIPALSFTSMPGGRSSLIEGKNFSIFNDCYNSSPSSAKAVIDMIGSGWEGDKHCILGEMLELGEQSSVYHRELGVFVGKFNFKTIVYVGGFSSEFSKGVIEGGGDSFIAEDPIVAAKIVVNNLTKGDLVAVKGSRGIHLELAINELMESQII